MTLVRTTLTPLRVVGRKTDMRTQFAALPWRMSDGKPQILLITSRDTGRWILPKGWPMQGETPADAAATEAWEEAGVKGRVAPACIGIYSYDKAMEEGSLPVAVAVFPVEVEKLAKRYPEAGDRRRRWFSRRKAAEKVAEPELRAILETFDPRVAR